MHHSTLHQFWSHRKNTWTDLEDRTPIDLGIKRHVLVKFWCARYPSMNTYEITYLDKTLRSYQRNRPRNSFPPVKPISMMIFQSPLDQQSPLISLEEQPGWCWVNNIFSETLLQHHQFSSPQCSLHFMSLWNGSVFHFLVLCERNHEVPSRFPWQIASDVLFHGSEIIYITLCMSLCFLLAYAVFILTCVMSTNPWINYLR